MNGAHFKAFLWLRWRLAVNQMRRAGTASFVLMIIFAAVALLAGLGMFIGFFFVGWLALAEAPRVAILLVWDGLVGAFLFFWLLGLLTELQRSEMLALTNFLHLPVSVRSVFLINYLGSLITLSLIVFLPAMTALVVGLICSRGAAYLLVFPLLAAFVLAVTALTYQFRGWLAALMANPRRRRTIIVVASMLFLLVIQLPNLLNMMGVWRRPHGANRPDSPLQVELNALDKALHEKRLNVQEYQAERQAILTRHRDEARQRERALWDDVERIANAINLALPLGWLPYGAAALADEDALTGWGVLAPLLGTLGLAAIGGASLWRSYATTLRLYTGAFTAGKPRPGAAPPPAVVAAGGAMPRTTFLDKRLPWLSEPAAAIALATFRSLLRAPEAKMMLLSPILLAVIFGSTILTQQTPPHLYLRPLMAAGAIAMTLLSLGQLMGNQFGFDRAGFRTYVLCPARRRDVLLGKNVAFAPLAAGFSILLIGAVQAIHPMRLDHLLATVPHFVALFLIFCMMMNWLSLLAPMAIAAGSMKPASKKGMTILIHLLFTLLMPIVLGPTLLPLGIEYLLVHAGWIERAPVALALTTVLAALVAGLYALMLHWQGLVLQGRERRILELVTAKAE